MLQFIRLTTFGMLLMLAAGLTAAQTVPDFANLADAHASSVVRIEARVEQPPERQNQMDRLQEQMPELYRYFFGDQMPFSGPQQPRRERRSQGSGFIVSTDGYIVTNHHVVADATHVQVRTQDSRIFEADIIGTDEQSDVALLKVDARDLPAVEFADSDRLRVGEWVLAIGAPFGMDYSVTAGIVSAKGRSLGERYVPFIQSDVAINPGNSGGPLFNAEGRVVGVNSQIYTRSGGFMGLSFAIPSNLVESIVTQLKDTGTVERGWLGIAMDSNYNDDPDLAQSFGLDRPIGALVVEVYPDTPAAAAGLRPGDLILEFDGAQIQRFSDLAPMVGATPPGSEVELTVMRDGERMPVPLTIGALPDNEPGMRQPEDSQDAPRINRLNLEVRDLQPEESRQLGGTAGVVVTGVVGDPGAAAGFAPGDVITMIQGQQITDVESFNQVLTQLPENRRVAVRIVRDGVSRFVAVRL